jgi:2-hydroxychromene-2-carboxylate isomerase
MQEVTFFFDPGCPWCYQTSKWVKRLEAAGELALDYGVFSLQVLNLEDGKDPLELEPTGSPQLRTAVLIAARQGSKAIGPYYTELGKRTFERSERTSRDPEQVHATIRGSLTAGGLDPGLLDDALADPKTWSTVVEETQRLHDIVGDVGVPTIVLDGGEGPAIFGPVIVDQPSDRDAIELWHHVEWLTRYGNFAELKRKRNGLPVLPSMESYRTRQ